MADDQQSGEIDETPYVEFWLNELGKMDQSELEALAERAMSIEEVVELRGPRNPEELDQYFKEVIGVDLPKVAVCEGHTDVFTIVCEIVFFKVLRVLIIASRGGGKTSLMAWIHNLQAEHWPGYGGITVGASAQQGKRMYAHLLPFVVEGGVVGGKEMEHIRRSIETETIWNTGSKVEILPATIAAVNGPREPRLHRDEIEIMYREKPDVYKQSGNIPAGRKTKDGRYVPAQIVDTSTMKWAHGIVAEIKEEYENAIAEGRKPEREVRIFCLFEIAEEMPHCQMVSDDQREARLKELGPDGLIAKGLPPDCEKCDCHEIIKGTWEDEDHTPRTLADVCAGRFFRSRGFKPHDDVVTLFYENDRRTWEAEQECSRPSGEGLYIQSFSRQRHGLKSWTPDPAYGPIYQAVDWGGTDEHSVGWYQETEVDVVVEMYDGAVHVVPAGSTVRFAEIWVSGIGNVALGHRVIQKEDKWRTRWPGWRVVERYPDSANRSGVLDWRDHLGLETKNYIKKDFDEEVSMIRTVVDDREFYVVVKSCLMFVKSIEAWREEHGNEVHDWTSHAMAEARYFFHNRNVVKRRQGRQKRESQPAASGGAELQGDEADVTGKTARREVVGVGGAEDSPFGSGSRRMNDSGWRSGYGYRNTR